MPEVLQEVGALAGLAAVVGLAVLSALYFSQARDLRRLREWAGRAPERAAEAQARAQAAAPAQRPAQAPVAAKPVAAKPAAAAPAAGTQAKPPAAAPAAAKTADGEAAPSKPAPAPGPAQPAAPAGKPAPATAAAAAGAAAKPAEQKPEGDKPGEKKPDEKKPDETKPPAPAAKPDGGAPATTPPAPPAAPKPAVASGAGQGDNGSDRTEAPKPAQVAASAAGAKPAAATQARPVPPRTAPAPRPAAARPPSLPRPQTAVLPTQGQPPEKRGWLPAPRYLALLVAGMLVVGAGAAYAVTELLGEEDKPATEERAAPANGNREEAGSGGEQTETTPRRVNPSTVTVAVLNGTAVDGLASRISDKVAAAGFQKGNVTNAEQTEGAKAESVILYADGAKAEAQAVAKELGISQIEPIDSESQRLGGNATVVVVVGEDQA